VCVLGAGAVGLATAYELNLAGHEVTVIDRARPGSGACGGNGSQFSYSYVQPLADPGIWAQLPKLLLSLSSPLKIRPQLGVHQWRWALQFLAACNAATSRSTTIALLKLAAESRQGFDTMLARKKLAVDFSSTGKLVLFSCCKSFAAAHALFPQCSAFAALNPWAGLRPATPTALPLIGRHTMRPSARCSCANAE